MCCGIEPAGHWREDRSDARWVLHGLDGHLSPGGLAVQLYGLLVVSSLDACDAPPLSPSGTLFLGQLDSVASFLACDNVCLR